jgi:phosphinothricin acetyltransferase
MEMITVRRAERVDCAGILEIYNDAVLTTTATYDYEPRSLEHRQAWFDDHHRTGLPIFTAIHEGRVIGWSAINWYHDRAGYRFTGENSIYIAPLWRGKGVGKRLLAPTVEAGREFGLHVIIAAIDATNEASIRLHERFGFEQVGLFKRVGYKFGRWLDVVYLELLLPEPAKKSSR